MNPEDEAEEDGANIDLDSQRKGKCVVLKTSTRQVNKLAWPFWSILPSYHMHELSHQWQNTLWNFELVWILWSLCPPINDKAKSLSDWYRHHFLRSIFRFQLHFSSVQPIFIKPHFVYVNMLVTYLQLGDFLYCEEFKLTFHFFGVISRLYSFL